MKSRLPCRPACGKDICIKNDCAAKKKNTPKPIYHCFQKSYKYCCMNIYIINLIFSFDTTVVWRICFLRNFNSSISLEKIQQADISSLNFTSVWWKRITYNFIFYYFPQLTGKKTANSLLCRCQFLAFHGTVNASVTQVCHQEEIITFVYECIINQTNFYLSQCYNFSINHYLYKHEMTVSLKKNRLCSFKMI